MPTLILDRKAVNGLLDMKATIRAVEQAFRDWTEGKATMPAKSYLSLEKGDFRAMPAALPGAAGVKWVNVHTGNPAANLPTVMAVLIYSDPNTGYPLAIMDATNITAFRTGATAAIAARHLARPESRTLGIIGAGRQSYTQVIAHAEVFNLELIRVHDVLPAAVRRLIDAFPQFRIVESGIEEAAASDIVCTLTPARKPVLRKEWVRPGTHINAIGADAQGKEELEPAVLKDAVVVVDDLRQATASGEINVPVARGIYTPGEVFATLGEIIAGRKRGRKGPGDVTVFDSTGVAIEDIAIARLVYEQAKGGVYPAVDLV